MKNKYKTFNPLGLFSLWGTGLLITFLMQAASLHGQSDAVELDPGVLQGTVSISGETVNSGGIIATSSTGLNASTSLINGTYELTVAGDQSWRPYIYANVVIDGVYTTLWYYRNHSNEAIYVPAGEIVNLDFNLDAARINGTIDVYGGVVTYYRITANGSEGTRSYRAETSYSGSHADGFFSFPMITDTEVTLTGIVTLMDNFGAEYTLPLDAMTINHSAESNVYYEFDLNNIDDYLGEVTGIVDILNTAPLRYHYVNLSGRYNSETEGLYFSQRLDNNGSFDFTSLIPGYYSIAAYTYLASPYNFLQHPYSPDANNWQIEVAAGAITEVNFIHPLGYATGTVEVTGFADNSDITGGYVYADGIYGSESYGGYGQDNLDPLTREFDLALPEGEWNVYRFGLYFQDFSDPSDPNPLNAQFFTLEYARRNPDQQISILREQTTQVPSFTANTVQTEVLFDVVEPEGEPETNLQSPRVYGSAREYDAENHPIDHQFSSYGSNLPQPQGRVKIIAPPGVYQATAQASVNGSWTTFARFDLNLLPPSQTPTGSDVPVEASESVEMTFENVVEEGVTTATELPVGPQSPAGFRIHAPGGSPVYYDITTTAVFEGQVEVCIDYDDSGIPAGAEGSLTLQHYNDNAEPAIWEDITTELDTVSNRICGLTDSFSLFALFLSENQAPEVDCPAEITGECGELVEFMVAAVDSDGNTLNYEVLLDGQRIDSGAISGQAGTPTALEYAFSQALPVGEHSLAVNVSDGIAEPVSCTTMIHVVDTTSPDVGAIAIALDPFLVGATVEANAPVADCGGIASLTWNWGDGTASAGLIVSDYAVGQHVYAVPGVYQVTLTAGDESGNAGTAVFEFVVVYDPEGGFVTGGGWVRSPLGALTADPILTGKASFGFVAKYKKGANVPSGNTEFQFKAGDLNFKSAAYDWLVVAGSRAQFKGNGTINGTGDFGFMLTGIDGDLQSNGNPDQFRIKIWDRATGFAVYDNQLGSADDSELDAATELGGGSIVIHKAK